MVICLCLLWLLAATPAPFIFPQQVFYSNPHPPAWWSVPDLGNAPSFAAFGAAASAPGVLSTCRAVVKTKKKQTKPALLSAPAPNTETFQKGLNLPGSVSSTVKQSDSAGKKLLAPKLEGSPSLLPAEPPSATPSSPWVRSPRDRWAERVGRRGAGAGEGTSSESVCLSVWGWVRPATRLRLRVLYVSSRLSPRAVPVQEGALPFPGSPVLAYSCYICMTWAPPPPGGSARTSGRPAALQRFLSS